MHLIGLIVSLVITGLIVGALGRLVIPGRNDMSIPATIGVGLLGALVGGLVAGALHLGWLLAIILEVAVAAGLVYVLSRRGAGAGGRRPGAPI